MRNSRVFLFGAVGVLLAFPFVCCGGCLMVGAFRAPRTPPSKRATPISKATPETQAERRKLIEETMKLGVLQKLDAAGGTTLKAYVMPAFRQLTFDRKQAFASVWFAYAVQLPKGDKFGPNHGHMPIRDAMNGKDIGNIDYMGLRIY